MMTTDGMTRIPYWKLLTGTTIRSLICEIWTQITMGFGTILKRGGVNTLGVVAIGNDPSGFGWSATERLPDTLNIDGDLFLNRIDLDSDNDGISDLAEGGLSELVDSVNGRIDGFLDANGNGANDAFMGILENSDADQLPKCLGSRLRQ